MEEKKQSKGLIIAIIILILIIIGMGSFILYDKVLNPSNISNEEKTNSTKNENTTPPANDKISTSKEDNVSSSTTTQTSKCTGTYYGESKEQNNDLKYIYVLNTDGTFTAKFGDVQGTSGVYVINDNTISFVGQKHTVGPRDQDPYYSTQDYVIADDCSYILVNTTTSSFKLIKQ